MTQETKKYPMSVALYKNKFAENLILNSFPALEQEQADKLCQAIQAAVGGIIEVREKGGTSQNGKRLPDFELLVLSLDEVTRRKAFGAQQKALREAQSNTQSEGDGAL